jgi:parallel beta-helix repeat protein
MNYRCFGVCGVMTVLGTLSGVSADVLLVPGQYETIQVAIEDAIAGDTVQVAAGLYNERIDFLGKAIAVVGAGAAATTIDGSGLDGPVVRFASEEASSSVLDGFRIGHGSGEMVTDPVFGQVKCGGGIYIGSASPTIRNCELRNNASWGGAGACVIGGQATFSDCVFGNNIAEGHGGGMYLLYSALPTLERCRFEANTASWGGGMTCHGFSDVTILDCEFEGNITNNVGGGIFIRSSSSPTVDGCTFIGNIQISNPVGSGGGICVYGSGNGGGPCYPIISNCLFEGNTVTGDGGGMSNAYGSYATVTNCTFRGNTGGRDGGGVACVGADDPDVPSNSHLVNCVFEDNSTAGRGGGFFSRASEPTLEGCVIRGNTADSGGGAYFFESPLAGMTDTAICGNSLEQVVGTHYDGGGNSIDEECEVCAADITGDGFVGVDDILAIIGEFGPCEGCAADVDGDGIVGVDDILIVLSAWGPC